jgi:hypothetical protein
MSGAYVDRGHAPSLVGLSGAPFVHRVRGRAYDVLMVELVELVELVRIKREAEQMLSALAVGSAEGILRTLHPRAEDYDRVFTPEAAPRARVGYTALWNAPPRGLGKPGQTEVHAVACTAGSLRSDNEFSRAFPGGYQRIAGHLKPEVVWVAFKVVVPGKSLGMAHDGLVYLGDHWAWFPQPWRVLSSGDDN